MGNIPFTKEHSQISNGVKVKICGITTISDALKAVEYGADALGFVLADSPRKITPAKLKKISLAIPPFISKVGVFVNEKASRIKQLLTEGIIDYAQLHGDEDIEYCRALPVKKVIKAIRPGNLSDIKKAGSFKDAGAILVDSFTPTGRGGTGELADWNLALKTKSIGPPLILSGGLNIENIEEAVKKVRPYAVDVSSGVEKLLGRKDYRLLKTFIQRAR